MLSILLFYIDVIKMARDRLCGLCLEWVYRHLLSRNDNEPN